MQHRHLLYPFGVFFCLPADDSFHFLRLSLVFTFGSSIKHFVVADGKVAHVRLIDSTLTFCEFF